MRRCIPLIFLCDPMIVRSLSCRRLFTTRSIIAYCENEKCFRLLLGWFFITIGEKINVLRHLHTSILYPCTSVSKVPASSLFWLYSRFSKLRPKKSISGFLAFYIVGILFFQLHFAVFRNLIPFRIQSMKYVEIETAPSL